MNKHSKMILPMLVLATVLATVLISACAGGAPAENASNGSKVEAVPVEFTGVIEVMDGNQWVINGKAITVEPSVLRDGPFNIGDTVKVEVEIQADGIIVVTSVETSEALDAPDENNSNDDQVNNADDENDDTDDDESDDDDDDSDSDNEEDDNSGSGDG